MIAILPINVKFFIAAKEKDYNEPKYALLPTFDENSGSRHVFSGETVGRHPFS